MENSNTEVINLWDYWNILQRRWKLALVVSLSLLILGAAFTLLQTRMYEGVATVLVENATSQFEELGMIGNLGPRGIPVETEMEIIKSRTVAEKVVLGLGLDSIPLRYNDGKRFIVKEFRSDRFPATEKPEFKVVLTEGNRYALFTAAGEKLGDGELGAPFEGKGVAFTLNAWGYAPGDQLQFRKIPLQSAVASLRRSMDISEVGKKTNIIRIGVLAPDPILARDIANKITDVYVSMNIERKSQEASQMLAFIEQQLESIHRNLERGEQELDQLKTEKGIFVLSETANKLIEQISKLELSRADLQLRERQVSRLLESLKSARENDAPYLLGQASLSDVLVTQLIGELSQKLIELRGLRQDLTDENPRVALISAQIDELKGKVRTAVENANASLNNQLETINRIIGGYEDQLKSLPQAERELAALTRKSEVNADLYTFLLKKHEEARISRAGIVGNARVIDSAIVPAEASSPKIVRNLAMFLLLGFMAGISFVFLLEYVDDSIKTVHDIEALGYSVYGAIPYVSHDFDSPLLISSLDSKSAVQEAFRSLRTNLTFSDPNAKIKTMICVGAVPGIGKTTLVANLAITLAQSGKKVLLIDADLRRPQLHRYFELPEEPGLSNTLIGATTWRDCVKPVALNENLFVLPAGLLPPNPVELLASPKFSALMDEVAKEYDFVLYDAPPIVAFTDAAIISARADAVFLVIEPGRSKLALVQRAIELLENVNVKPMGTIVNKGFAASGGSYDYSAYGYQYYGVSEPELPLLGRILKKLTNLVS